MVKRGVFWLLVEGQQLPWLLWLVPLIVITQTIFANFSRPYVYLIVELTRGKLPGVEGGGCHLFA
jgi:hypothetical protein